MFPLCLALSCTDKDVELAAILQLFLSLNAIFIQVVIVIIFIIFYCFLVARGGILIVSMGSRDMLVMAV